MRVSVPRGVLALVKGRSGSGKTTLFNLVGGPDEPTAGSVWVDGHGLGRMSADARGAAQAARQRCVPDLWAEVIPVGARERRGATAVAAPVAQGAAGVIVASHDSKVEEAADCVYELRDGALVSGGLSWSETKEVA